MSPTERYNLFIKKLTTLEYLLKETRKNELLQQCQQLRQSIEQNKPSEPTICLQQLLINLDENNKQQMCLFNAQYEQKNIEIENIKNECLTTLFSSNELTTELNHAIAAIFADSPQSNTPTIKALALLLCKPLDSSSQIIADSLYKMLSRKNLEKLLQALFAQEDIRAFGREDAALLHTLYKIIKKNNPEEEEKFKLLIYKALGPLISLIKKNKIYILNAKLECKEKYIDTLLKSITAFWDFLHINQDSFPSYISIIIKNAWHVLSEKSAESKSILSCYILNRCVWPVIISLSKNTKSNDKNISMADLANFLKAISTGENSNKVSETLFNILVQHQYHKKIDNLFYEMAEHYQGTIQNNNKKATRTQSYDYTNINSKNDEEENPKSLIRSASLYSRFPPFFHKKNQTPHVKPSVILPPLSEKKTLPENKSSSEKEEDQSRTYGNE